MATESNFLEGRIKKLKQGERTETVKHEIERPSWKVDQIL